MRTRFELADVVHRFAPSLHDCGKLTPLQEKVFAKIALCRTAALGGHEEACDNCGTIRYSRASHMGAETLTSSEYRLSRPGCWILPGWPMEKHQFLYPSGRHH
jgi:hypothetical protein